MNDLRVTRLRAGHGDPTPWVPTSAPTLSWATATDRPGWMQSGAEVAIADAPSEAPMEVVSVHGRGSVDVAWPFAALPPREPRWISVRTTGDDGGRSPWSTPVEVRSAELERGRWHASPIAHPVVQGPVLLRGLAVVTEGLRRATLYATARGAYQISLNGVDVDDHALKPGWSSFDLRLPYETTDVTGLLRIGLNVMGVRLAGGWFTERYYRSEHDRPTWGDHPSMACQLVLEYADGTVETVVSDGGWRASVGEILESGIYLGERADSSREPAGWRLPGFDAGAWLDAKVEDWPTSPTPRIGPPARRIQELRVAGVSTSPSGRTILDFGQNIVGRLRVRVVAPAGTRVVLQHAEVLDGGELALRPLRTAEATDELLHDGVDRWWEPEFTFHGFRYATVDGLPGGIDPEDVRAVVIHSELTRTGWFDSSSPMLNRLHENVVWSMRDNFLHLPTDCPQRDERQGWTGDIQVFAPTAATLFDVGGFLTSWLTDLRLEQAERGAVPFIVPDPNRIARPPAAAWGDAATVVPWTLFERLGDSAILAAQYESMVGWVEQIIAAAGDDLIWRGGFQFGDWLDPDAPPEDPGAAKAPKDLVATAYFHRSALIVARAAAQLGRGDDERRYAELAERVRCAWIREFQRADRIVSDAPTAYALAIAFGIAAEEDVPALGDRLAHLVAANGHRVGTGFVGTPIIADALTRGGHLDTAGRLLLQTECPSWLYPVTMGATTVWERWDSLLPDGTLNPGEMTSFNHYALGAVVDWMHRAIAGLGPDAPGYSRIRIAPRPVAGIDSASSTIDTPYGIAAVTWRSQEEGGAPVIRVDARVPANTTARFEWDGRVHHVGAGRHSWLVPDLRAENRSKAGDAPAALHAAAAR